MLRFKIKSAWKIYTSMLWFHSDDQFVVSPTINVHFCVHWINFIKFIAHGWPFEISLTSSFILQFHMAFLRTVPEGGREAAALGPRISGPPICVFSLLITWCTLSQKTTTWCTLQRILGLAQVQHTELPNIPSTLGLLDDHERSIDPWNCSI